MDWGHSEARIEQFRRESCGDREKFERKILCRAMKSSPAKNEITARILEQQGEHDLACRVRLAQVMKNVNENFAEHSAGGRP
jgi:hypothetical protein